MLVLCEKPSVATDVAKALQTAVSKFEKQPWGFESPDYVVTAAAGHLVAECTPDQYDPAHKDWSYEQLPILPDEFKYVPRDKRAADRLKQLKQLMDRDDVTTLVNACDAGREGELIFKLIVQFANSGGKPIKRAWFSSMTPTAIQAAFAQLREDSDMIPLEYAARCRAEADWFVGMNATRAATCTLGGSRQMLSMGRVQTPTLAMIVNRDLEIEDFTPEDYFCVKTSFSVADGTYDGKWWAAREPGSVDRFSTREEAMQIVDRITGKTGTVSSVEVKDEKVNPPKLFDLTDLQREANRRFGMTAAKTLEAAQACYETHKVLSYPRTDSRFLPSDMAPMVPQLLKTLSTSDPELAPFVAQVAADGSTISKIINDAKISDHHALIPTDANHDLSKLTDQERKIFDLVARRFIASLLDPQEVEKTTIWTTVEEDNFKTTGKRIVKPGWTVALPQTSSKDEQQDDDDLDAESLPKVVESESANVDKSEVTEHQTKPPQKYNESSLLGAMATAGRQVTDDDAADAMKDSGLGTPATRASIIERLMKIEYLERQGKNLSATSKGRGLIVALGEHKLTQPDLTGAWEKRLRDLEACKPSDAPGLRESFVSNARSFAKEIVDGLLGATPEQLRAGQKKLAACPVSECEGEIVESARGWGCDSYKGKEEPGCGFVFWKEQSGKKQTEKTLLKFVNDVAEGKAEVTKPVEKRIIADCPQCDGNIVTRAKSFGCDSWKSKKDSGCGFVIWRSNPDGSECSENDALTLIAAGKTNARPPAKTVADCPRCKGKIVEREKAWSCNSWSPKKKGCGTVVWRVQSGSEVTEEERDIQLAAMVGTKASAKKKRT